MSATELPDHPVYAFAPVADPDTDLSQIRIGIDIAIGTSPVALDIDRAMVVADRLNQRLEWTRELDRLRRRTAARGGRRSGLVRRSPAR